MWDSLIKKLNRKNSAVTVMISVYKQSNLFYFECAQPVKLGNTDNIWDTNKNILSRAYVA